MGERNGKGIGERIGTFHGNGKKEKDIRQEKHKKLADGAGKWAAGICLLVLAVTEILGSAAISGEKIGCSRVHAAENAEETADAGAVRKEDPAGDYAFRLRQERKAEDYILLRTSLDDYVVEQGDSLWKIAKKNLGDGGRWGEIAEINRLPDPDLILPKEKLVMPDLEYYLQKPSIQRGEGYYLSDEGAFRFQTPERWALATCSLDSHLSTFIGDDTSVRVLWGIEDNRMGEDAWAEKWDEVCENIKKSAETVFDESLEDIFCEKYELESGNEVYNICCRFRSEAGKLWTVSAAYRFGEKNLMEFIGIGLSDHSLDMGKLTLYTAATYEEYEEERHMGFGEDGAVYRGMEVWDYPMLHNPFVLSYECVNKETWRQKREPEEIKEDYVMEWEEPVLPAVIKKALGIEGDIRYSDVLKIESLEAIESVGYDYCSINEERFETDWKDIPDGDALLEDIAKCEGLYSLRIQIGDISDFAPLGKLKMLEELEIQAGRTVTDTGFLEELEYLRKCVLEKAPQQKFVDSLSDKLWEKTCEEEGLTTFKKMYDGEPGLAFDEVGDT